MLVTRPTRAWLRAAITITVIAAGTSTALHAHDAKRRAAPPPAPAAPASLKAEGSTGKVFLDWAPVPGADGYKIFRAAAGVWNPEPVASAWHSSATQWGLANGVAYAFKVVAFNRGGTGPASPEAAVTPVAPPTNLAATPGSTTVTLAWRAAPGATSYAVFRRRTYQTGFVRIGATAATTFADTGLTNGKRYVYRLRSIGINATSVPSDQVEVTPKAPPVPPPTDAPASLSATPGSRKIQLAWTAVAGAANYRVFRTTTGAFGPAPVATVKTPGYLDSGLVNGTAYSYRVTARNEGGDGPFSATVTATPGHPPPAPLNLSATPDDAVVTLSWSPSERATSYKVYRGTSVNGQLPDAIASALTAAAFVDKTVTNGVTYFYKVTAVNISGESPRSGEVSAMPTAPPVLDPAVLSSFRLLRHSTWGPHPGDVDRVRTIGADAFLAEQFEAPRSGYPAVLFNQSLEMAQEQFMANALTGADQLRQRVAWALHKIWVVSGVEIDSPAAIITYYNQLSSGAFGSYRELMRAMTLNPAMGRYLNMRNNRSQAITGVPPNENYPREVLQLFTMGTARLNADGTPVLDAEAPVPAYTEADVKALARLLTGWTFGDGDPSTKPRRLANENWKVPMEAVERYHDVTAKTFLGRDFAAGQTAQQDLDQALDAIFEHPNVAPFVSRQLIQQLVMSNPSSAYVADVASVFTSSGGNLRAVVRALLLHPEAERMTPSSGKLSEPVLYAASTLRALNASVTDHPFMSDRVALMGQNVFFPPSVFSYFSPGYRVRGTGTPPLGGPEFQILTTVTAFERVNFMASLLGGSFGTNVTVDYTPFRSLAANPAVLVDYCNLLFMGGAMSPEERAEIIAAVGASPATSPNERTRTALFLTLVSAQGQVDR